MWGYDWLWISLRNGEIQSRMLCTKVVVIVSIPSCRLPSTTFWSSGQLLASFFFRALDICPNLESISERIKWYSLNPLNKLNLQNITTANISQKFLCPLIPGLYSFSLNKIGYATKVKNYNNRSQHGVPVIKNAKLLFMLSMVLLYIIHSYVCTYVHAYAREKHKYMYIYTFPHIYRSSVVGQI